MEDKQIISLFNERSEQAISELSEKYGKLCLRIANNILDNPQDAEECVNDAYLGVWNSIPPQNPSSLRPYICRIVRNISLKKLRANSAKKRNSCYEVSLSELEDCIPDTSFFDSITENELAGLINDFIATLDYDDRVMFIRRYWFSEPLSGIAELFSITEHNAAVRLGRIRGKLRNYLNSKGVSI